MHHDKPPPPMPGDLAERGGGGPSRVGSRSWQTPLGKIDWAHIKSEKLGAWNPSWMTHSVVKVKRILKPGRF